MKNNFWPLSIQEVVESVVIPQIGKHGLRSVQQRQAVG